MSEPRFPHLPDEAWQRYLDDAASPEAAARVDAHLDDCAPCRAALERLDASRAFRRLRGLRVRPPAWDGFWEEIAGEIATAQAPVRAPRRRAWVAWAVAASLLVAAIALHVTRDVQPGGTQARDAGDAGAREIEPCPEKLAALRLTREECEELRKPIQDEPMVILESTLDLRGL